MSKNAAGNVITRMTSSNPIAGFHFLCRLVFVIAVVFRVCTTESVAVRSENNKFNGTIIVGRREAKGSSYGYWYHVAQAKALVIAIENGVLPKVPQYSNLITPADCGEKEGKMCRDSKELCAKQQADLLLNQLRDNDKKDVASSVSLYSHQISQNCDLNADERKFAVAEISVPHPVPVFHCNSYLNQTSVITHFRMEYSPNVSAIFANLSSELIPRYFVLELGVGNTEHKLEWKLAPDPVQVYWMFRFNTRPGLFYRIRVTAVSPKYIYSPVTSTLIRVHDTAELNYKAPKNIQLMNILVDNSTVKARPSIFLRWESDSGENASCSHDIFYMGDDVHKWEQRKAENAFWVELKELHFDQEYHVRVIEKFGKQEAEISTNILVPSCLHLRGYSFKLCAPPPPTNIRLENPTEHSFRIVWDLPKFVTSTNPILYYNLTIDWIHTPTTPTPPVVLGTHPSTTIVPGLAQFHNSYIHRSQRYKTRRVFEATVSKASIQVKNATKLRGQFKVSVIAVGEAGASEPSGEFVYYYGSPLLSSWTLGNILVGIFSVLCIIFGISAVVFLKHSYGKRQRKERRREIFENYERETWQRELNGSRDSSKWEIDCCTLTLGDAIGQGNFGLVRKATLTLAGIKTVVAVKTLRADSVDNKDIDRFWEEFEILKNLDPHLHVVGLRGIVTRHVPQPLLVVEYCDGGDLQSYLRKVFKTPGLIRRYTTLVQGSLITADYQAASTTTAYNSRTFTRENYFLRNSRSAGETTSKEYEAPVSRKLTDLPLQTVDLLSYARQIAFGMEYLSSNKIVHRDLAARNILLSGEAHKILKISDFGLSRDVYEQNWYKMSSSGKIPIKWLAIESILKDMYTTKTDVWAFGILLWEIFTFGGNPYPGVENIKVFDLINSGYRMPRPDTCPIDVYMLMRHCWEHDPSQRPDFTGIRLILEDIIERTSQVAYVSLECNPSPVLGNSSSERISSSQSVSLFSNDDGFQEETDLYGGIREGVSSGESELEKVALEKMPYKDCHLTNNPFQGTVNYTK